MVEKPQVKMALGGQGVDSDDIALHTRALQEMLEDAIPEAEVEQVVRPGHSGEKGDPVTLGAIMIGLITSGAVKAVIECIGTIIARDRRLTIEISRKDGSTVKVDAANVSDKRIEDTLQKVLG